MNNNKKIFISYSWSDMKIVDEIERDLSRFNLNIVRDVRDLEYKDSISDFMETIRAADFALLLISNSYLRSRNCMSEVLHLIKERNYNDKVLPIIIDGTCIYSVEDRLEYTMHWLRECDSLKERISSIPATLIPNEILKWRAIEDISREINVFLTYICDRKNLTFSELKKEGYESIFSFLGYDDVSHLVKLLQISIINDIDEKEIALDQWMEENKPTTDAYSIRASISSCRGHFKRAELNFDKALFLNSNNAYAMNNYGFMLLKRDIEHDKARRLFEMAIESMPNLTEARLNLGVLLCRHFNDNEAAKLQYEEILSYNPTEEKAYNNLANYYKINRADTKENRDVICELYERAIALNPEYLDARLGYGTYLSESLGLHDEAIKHYDEILKIEPRASELVFVLKQRAHSSRTAHAVQKEQRNNPCSCGSGKKYKKCHGA